MSVLKTNSIQPATPGSEDYFLAKAWVNFNGTGTVAIRADGNVSSITDNAVGNYTVNFTIAMPDANFAAVASGSNDNGLNFPTVGVLNYAAGSVTVIFANNLTSGSADQTTASIAIFR